MEMWTEIRRKVLVEGTSRSITRDYRDRLGDPGEILADAEPPGLLPEHGSGQAAARQFLGIIDEILLVDNGAPVERRHTVKRDVRAAK